MANIELETPHKYKRECIHSWHKTRTCTFNLICNLGGPISTTKHLSCGGDGMRGGGGGYVYSHHKDYTIPGVISPILKQAKRV